MHASLRTLVFPDATEESADEAVISVESESEAAVEVDDEPPQPARLSAIAAVSNNAVSFLFIIVIPFPQSINW